MQPTTSLEIVRHLSIAKEALDDFENTNIVQSVEIQPLRETLTSYLVYFQGNAILMHERTDFDTSVNKVVFDNSSTFFNEHHKEIISGAIRLSDAIMADVNEFLGSKQGV